MITTKADLITGINSLRREQDQLHDNIEQQIRNDLPIEKHPTSLYVFCEFSEIVVKAISFEDEIKGAISRLRFISRHMMVTAPILTIVSLLSLLKPYLDRLTGDLAGEIDTPRDLLLEGVLISQIILNLYERSLLISTKQHRDVTIGATLLCRDIYDKYRGFLEKLHRYRDGITPERLEILLECSKNIGDTMYHNMLWGDMQILNCIEYLIPHVQDGSMQELKECLETTKDVALTTKGISCLASGTIVFDGIIFLLFSNLFALMANEEPLIDLRLTTSITLIFSIVGSIILSLNNAENVDAFINNILDVPRAIRDRF